VPENVAPVWRGVRTTGPVQYGLLSYRAATSAFITKLSIAVSPALQDSPRTIRFDRTTIAPRYPTHRAPSATHRGREPGAVAVNRGALLHDRKRRSAIFGKGVVWAGVCPGSSR